MRCEKCNGTGLLPWGQFKKYELYSADECDNCGGKGYVHEGETEYYVALFVDTIRRQQFYVIARNACEALQEAAGMLALTEGQIKPGEEAALVVEEHSNV
jgi:hypothetical protein